jgi:hypothetical protein
MYYQIRKSNSLLFSVIGTFERGLGRIGEHDLERMISAGRIRKVHPVDCTGSGNLGRRGSLEK